MGHAYSSNFVHCVFSTKDRAPLIDNPEHLWAYISGIATNHHIPVLTIGGMQDHAHLLVVLPATITLSDLINKMKSNSSRWMSERGVSFAWQKGYGAFSVSPS